MFTETVSDFAGRRIREERKRRRWKTSDLAGKIAALGYTSITENVVKDIEGGRPGRGDGQRTRRIALEEVYACARALDCSPMSLLPSHDGGTDTLGPMSEESIEDAVTALQSWLKVIRQQKPE